MPNELNHELIDNTE